MAKILIAGMVNVETSVNVHHFPIEYAPIEYPFNLAGYAIGGVGYNVAKALKTLGDDVSLLSYVGNDLAGGQIQRVLQKEGFDSKNIKAELQATPLSIVLYDDGGARRIYCDLKDIQDHRYPPEEIDFHDYDLAVLTNANFTRSLLSKAKEQGCLIATDVQALGDIHDEYNADYMRHADILFLSNACFEGREEDMARSIYREYGNQTIVVGMGEKGALLYQGENDRITFVPAKRPREVVSTVGAGDALFSCFIHFFTRGEDVLSCLQKAVYFAGYKVGEKGASEGFLTEEELLQKLR